MVGALKSLGIKLEERWEAGEMTVHGCGGRFSAEGGELSLGNAGTAMRPLTAAVAAAGRGRSAPTARLAATGQLIVEFCNSSGV